MDSLLSQITDNPYSKKAYKALLDGLKHSSSSESSGADYNCTNRDTLNEIRAKMHKYMRMDVTEYEQWFADSQQSRDVQLLLLQDYMVDFAYGDFVPEFNTVLECYKYSNSRYFEIWKQIFRHQFKCSGDADDFSGLPSDAPLDQIVAFFERWLLVPLASIDAVWQLYTQTISSLLTDYDASAELIQKSYALYMDTKSGADELVVFESKVRKSGWSSDDWINYFKKVQYFYYKKNIKLSNKSVSKQKRDFLEDCKQRTILSVYQTLFYEFCDTYAKSQDTDKLDDFRFIFSSIILGFDGLRQNYDPKKACQHTGHIQDILGKMVSYLVRCFPENPVAWELFLQFGNFETYEDFKLFLIHYESLSGSLANKHWVSLAESILLFENDCVKRGNMDYIEALYTSCDGLFKESLNRKDPTISVQRLIIELYKKQDDLEECKSCCLSLIEKMPETFYVWQFVINFYKANCSLDETAQIYSQILKNNDKFFESSILLRDWCSFERLNGLDNFAKKRTLKVLKQKNDGADNENAKIDTESAHNKKRSSNDTDFEETTKRPKSTRNRENFSVKVRNLPENSKKQDIEAFFSDCGEIYSVNLSKTSCIIEFATKEGFLAALTKTLHNFQGNEIIVEKIINNTVFVTNFSELETPESMRQIFQEVGDIVSIRFPSLKFNVNRRFCYIEFADPQQAQEAVLRFDGKIKSRADSKFPLSVKISDPSQKNDRKSNATEEGKEVYVQNLDFYKCTNEDVYKLFQNFGKIVKVYLPTSLRDRNRRKINNGYGFVTFEDAESAQTAVSELNNTNFRGRILEVEIASINKRNSKRKKVIENLDVGKTTGEISNRQVSIFNIPDTLNATHLIEYLQEKIGKVVKVDMRPVDNVSYVEFADVKDAGKAELLLNGSEMFGSTVRVVSGRVQDKQMGKVDNRRKTENSHSAPSLNTGPKTNDDFRKMFLK